MAIPFSPGSSWPGIEPRYPALQAHSLPSEPQWPLIAYGLIAHGALFPRNYHWFKENLIESKFSLIKENQQKSFIPWYILKILNIYNIYNSINMPIIYIYIYTHTYIHIVGISIEMKRIMQETPLIILSNNYQSVIHLILSMSFTYSPSRFFNYILSCREIIVSTVYYSLTFYL